jgi:ribosome modulation factor
MDDDSVAREGAAAHASSTPYHMCPYLMAEDRHGWQRGWMAAEHKARLAAEREGKTNG